MYCARGWPLPGKTSPIKRPGVSKAALAKKGSEHQVVLSHVVVHQDVCVRGRVAGADPQGGGSGHCLLGPAEHGIRSTTGPR